MTSQLTVPLSSVANINANPSLGGKEFELDELIDFVPMATIDADVSVISAREARPYSEVRKGYTCFADGDILLAKITPCFENGKISQIRVGTGIGFGSTEFHVIRPHAERLDTRYLVHLLRQDKIRVEGERRMTGSGGQRRVPKSFLEALPIPLPPLSEQRRIAAMLDKADAMRAKRQEALAQLESLAQSIFVEMFGDAATNPKGWPEVKVGDVGDVQGGLQLSASRANLPLAVPYLRVANVYRDKVDLSEVKTFQATAAEFARTKLEHDDLLIVEGHGNPNEIGRCAIWNGAIADCSHQNHLIRVRINRQVAVPGFVSRFLNSAGGRKGLTSASNTTSGLNTISVGKVRACRLLLPPLPLQFAFVRRLEAVLGMVGRQSESMRELDRLFHSIQSCAFQGTI